MADPCPSVSPESSKACTLPDLAHAHLAGHEHRVWDGREHHVVTWSISPDDMGRWHTGDVHAWQPLGPRTRAGSQMVVCPCSAVGWTLIPPGAVA